MFICGNGSFSSQDESDNEPYTSPCSTPKRSRRSCKIIGRDAGTKNPYANRGLDKFYALLADLDDKKQKIYTQKGSEDISFVRFVYANDSGNVKPIVVKVKEKNPPKTSVIEQRSLKTTIASAQADDDGTGGGVTSSSSSGTGPTPSEKTMKKKRSLRCKGSFTIEDLKHPHFFFPVMVVLILLFLAIYGRSFAIFCTSIGWFLAPTVSPEVSTQRKPKRKKDYVSEKMMNEGPSSPKSVINGLNRLH